MKIIDNSDIIHHHDETNSEKIYCYLILRKRLIQYLSNMQIMLLSFIILIVNLGIEKFLNKYFMLHVLQNGIFFYFVEVGRGSRQSNFSRLKPDIDKTRCVWLGFKNTIKVCFVRITPYYSQLMVLDF